MSDDLKFSKDKKLVLTDAELNALQDYLDAHDRGGFYMLYNALTDSAEASLQSRVATFSGNVGGAALAANRLAQTQIGPGTEAGNYPGMYVLSQLIAQSAKDRGIEFNIERQEVITVTVYLTPKLFTYFNSIQPKRGQFAVV